MVAETFIPNPKKLPIVNHKDGNKKNNDSTNLEWSTGKENSIHAYEHGLMGIGEDFSASTITNKTCHKICKLLQDTSMTPKEISIKIKCSKKIVLDIMHKLTWTHISDNYDFSNRILRKNITKDTAILICKLLLTTNYNSNEIAEIVGCKTHNVKDIKRGKTWNKLYIQIKNDLNSKMFND